MYRTIKISIPRKVLTNNQLIYIQAEIKKIHGLGGDIRLQTLDEWAEAKLRPKFQPSRPVFSRLTSLNYAQSVIPSDDKRRNLRPAQAAIESLLIQWVKNQKILGNCLTGYVTRQKGKRLLEEIIALLPEEEKISFKFTSGWLWNFQPRWSLNSRKLHGEARDTDQADAAK